MWLEQKEIKIMDLHLCQFAPAAVTKDHTLDGLDNRN